MRRAHYHNFVKRMLSGEMAFSFFHQSPLMLDVMGRRAGTL